MISPESRLGRLLNSEEIRPYRLVPPAVLLAFIGALAVSKDVETAVVLSGIFGIFVAGETACALNGREERSEEMKALKADVPVSIAYSPKAERVFGH